MTEKLVYKLVEDIEQVKDIVYNQSDIKGYFLLIVDEDDAIITKYQASTENYANLTFSVDIMLHDLKSQLVDAFVDKKPNKDDV